jgi:hypothetical protein
MMSGPGSSVEILQRLKVSSRILLPDAIGTVLGTSFCNETGVVTAGKFDSVDGV